MWRLADSQMWTGWRQLRLQMSAAWPARLDVRRKHLDDGDIVVLGADIMLGILGWLLARLLLGAVQA